MSIVKREYADCVVKEFKEQGGCSVTLLIIPEADDARRKDFLVQLRPLAHALDLRISQNAYAIYSSLAPEIRALNLDLPRGLCAYEMEKLPGIPFSRLQPRIRTTDAESSHKLHRLITSLATIITHSYRTAISPPRTTRADSPMDALSLTFFSPCTGKVGSTIISRLQKLALQLPDAQLRAHASATLTAFLRLPAHHPVVLTHGDLIPSNILVDPETWEVTGLVDWAEAEYLPFGMCLYGVEGVLGYLSPASSASPEQQQTWTYVENAAELREMFWKRLVEEVGALVEGWREEKSERWREDVRVVRDVGVLLWYGFAWDGGRIERVVEEKRDEGEVVCLRAFLGVE